MNSQLLNGDPTLQMASVPLFLHDGWNPGPDLDKFFNSVYTYYVKRGYSNILYDELFDMFTLTCTLTFILSWFQFVNLRAVDECTSEITCSNLKIVTFDFTYTGFLYFSIVILAYITIIVHKIQNILQVRLASNFYSEELAISDDNLHMFSWESIVQRMKAAHSQIFINGHFCDYDIHTIANILMRHDNIMITLVTSKTIPAHFLNRVSQFALYEFVIKSIIGNQSIPTNNRRKLRVFGCLSFVMMPLSLTYISVLLIMNNSNNIRNKSAKVLFHRKLTFGSKYMIRQFNELPHEFDTRTEDLHEIATDFIRCFPAQRLNFLLNCIAFSSACVITFILLLSLRNEFVLIYLHWPFQEHFNLIWWLAFATSALSLTTSSQHSHKCSQKEDSSIKLKSFITFTTSEAQLLKVTKHLLPFQIVAIFYELFAFIASPFVFAVILPMHINKIAIEINESVVNTEFGVMCKHAQFVERVSRSSATLRHGVTQHASDINGASNLRQSLSENARNSLNNRNCLHGLDSDTRISEKQARSIYEFQKSNPRWLEGLDISDRQLVEHVAGDIMQMSHVSTSVSNLNTVTSESITVSASSVTQSFQSAASNQHQTQSSMLR